ncbi:lipid A core-O-antigen ligase-like enyme [Desulfocurvibacter africanus PCS]|uniref:Lipid A core-O-antigen ligase-like enyme n=1 Tax=Desulfocurvibacter africanus PCS TaxID=1262666 RepID=M5PP61_DESAF|nr:O-antigen ligase family protein [Desulfocurvibacter africanus]EMG35705.1 lipid A core-O-antigen ligase-like enyme [Desulfocurvibacter africanus PCS]
MLEQLKQEIRCTSLMERVLWLSYGMLLLSMALDFHINEFRTLALLACAFYLTKNRDALNALFSSQQFRTMLLFPLIALGAWLFGEYGENGLKTFDWLFVFSIGFVVANAFGRRAVWALLIVPIASILGALVVSIYHLLAYGGLDLLFNSARKMEFYISSANRMGFTFMEAGAIVLGMYFLCHQKARKWLLLLLGTIAYLCWLTQSRSAVFGFAGFMGIAILLSLRRGMNLRNWLPLLASVGVVIGGAVILAGGSRILPTITKMSWDFLLNGRDEIWLATWEMFKQAPVFGHGVDSFSDIMTDFLASPETLGRFPYLHSWPVFFNAHQFVLGILVETGLAGLVVFIAVIIRAVRVVLRHGIEAWPALLMLAAYIVHGTGSYGFHRSWISAFFFLPLGLISGLYLQTCARLVITNHAPKASRTDKAELDNPGPG